MKQDKDYYKVILMQYFSTSSIDWENMRELEHELFNAFMLESLIRFIDNGNVEDTRKCFDFLNDTYKNIWIPMLHIMFIDMDLMQEKISQLLIKSMPENEIFDIKKLIDNYGK